MRTSKSFAFKDLSLTKTRLLHWAQQFDEVVWLDSNEYLHKTSGKYEALLAADAFTVLKTDTPQAFEKLDEYQTHTKDWLFGYLTYDLKNDVEKLTSNNSDNVNFPDLFFFQPKKIIRIIENEIHFDYLNFVSDEITSDLNDILTEVLYEETTHTPPPKIKLRITKEAYQQQVARVKDHIAKGDIYEANFCQEFYAQNAVINPLSTYQALNSISKPPMASFLKLDNLYALCASPERYITKRGTIITSQPIKGTAKRSQDRETDHALAENLKNNAKERAENIMIVDLVRNDLSKTALKGSVRVNELCKIYSFEQVHQMVSTITSEIEGTTSPVEVLKSTFPMGSMTGAPKISAMKIIEQLESTKRGLYSGSIGYFTPEGNFDFNVVIRSILYNEAQKYLSLSVGGAITHKSDIDAEYDECLLKAKALRKVLE